MIALVWQFGPCLFNFSLFSGYCKLCLVDCEVLYYIYNENDIIHNSFSGAGSGSIFLSDFKQVFVKVL